MVKPRPLSLLLSCSSDHSVSIKIAITHPVTFATAAILVLFDSAAISTNVIVLTFKIVRMAGSAEGLILGPIIHKRTVYTIAVAAATTWIYPVVAWVGRVVRGMAEAGCPAGC